MCARAAVPRVPSMFALRRFSSSPRFPLSLILRFKRHFDVFYQCALSLSLSLSCSRQIFVIYADTSECSRMRFWSQNIYRKNVIHITRGKQTRPSLIKVFSTRYSQLKNFLPQDVIHLVFFPFFLSDTIIHISRFFMDLPSEIPLDLLEEHSRVSHAHIHVRAG